MNQLIVKTLTEYAIGLLLFLAMYAAYITIRGTKPRIRLPFSFRRRIEGNITALFSRLNELENELLSMQAEATASHAAAIENIARNVSVDIGISQLRLDGFNDRISRIEAYVKAEQKPPNPATKRDSARKVCSKEIVPISFTVMEKSSNTHYDYIVNQLFNPQEIDRYGGVRHSGVYAQDSKNGKGGEPFSVLLTPGFYCDLTNVPPGLCVLEILRQHPLRNAHTHFDKSRNRFFSSSLEVNDISLFYLDEKGCTYQVGLSDYIDLR